MVGKLDLGIFQTLLRGRGAGAAGWDAALIKVVGEAEDKVTGRSVGYSDRSVG